MPNRTGVPATTAAAIGGAAGHARHAASVNARDTAAKPNHAAGRPQCSSTGTSVPEAAMPSPTPVIINPLASPRRDAGTCASTADGPRIISKPPVNPANPRQTKNHRNGKGMLHAARETAEASIAYRTADATRNRAATGRAASAPAR